MDYLGFFNSCRKFFGVPDGSYLYAPEHISISGAETENENYIIEHLIKRFNGYTEEGYEAFLRNEILCDGEIKKMSRLSEYLLSNIDYDKVIAARRSNYKYLETIFKELNFLQSQPGNEAVPMVFPALTGNTIDRDLLNAGYIFIPTFWNDVQKRNQPEFEMENFLTSHLLPLPVDHRYNEDNMKKMAIDINRIL